MLVKLLAGENEVDREHIYRWTEKVIAYDMDKETNSKPIHLAGNK